MFSKTKVCLFWSLIVVLSVLIVLSQPTKSGAAQQKELRWKLKSILGDFPVPPPLQIRVLESERLDAGWRQKIEYLVEPADRRFDRPADIVRAYLFVPDHEPGDSLPAAVAIHQDGGVSHLGKDEPAGLAGGSDQSYGLELFERGYVVLAPDRFPHGERRRLPNPEAMGSERMRDLALWLRWSGQLILSGRTYLGKEVYDLMRAVDVLESLDFVDTDRIAAIGHSAGGNVLVYLMFMDQRIRAGVSSCGFFELMDYFNDNDRSFSNAVFALPGLANVGRSADYLALLAPRGVLLTRGLHEMAIEADSKNHVEETRTVATYTQRAYDAVGCSNQFKTIFFEGGHEFPADIRERAYQWLEQQLYQP